MSKLDDIAESTLAKIAARYITPIMAALIVYFVQGVDSSVEELERAQWKLFGEVENLRGVTQEKLTNLTDRMNRNDARLDKHEEWIGEIWRKNINEVSP